ncbi:MAG: hypothetical protein ABSC16_09835 [Candidatus Dormibacteria bacterium]|jgi:hypothetical protein|nr:hypothetical protein [Chloroflexota bacterium]
MDILPVLIETSGGVVGAMVTSPSGPPRGAAVILPGALGSTRSGLNQVFARLASSLAAVGVSSLRLDYPGSGESHLCRMSSWEESTAETIEWFRRRCGERNPVLVAECAGLLPAYREVHAGRGVSGVGLFLIPEPPAPGPARRQRGWRARPLARWVWRLPRRLMFRVRYGPPDPRLVTIWPASAYRALGGSEAMLREIAARVPLWVLGAEADPVTAELRRLGDRLGPEADCELEVVGGTSTGGSSLPGAADVVRAVTRWVDRLLQPAAVAAAATVADGGRAEAVSGDRRRGLG